MDIFSDIRTFLISAKKTNEIEIRFSERFMNGVSYEVYKNVMDMLSSDNEWSKKHIKDVTETGIDSFGTQVRKVNNIFQKKTREFFRDSSLNRVINFCKNELNMKLSSASEEPVAMNVSDFTVQYVRNRDRTSFRHQSGLWTIDITKVVDNLNKTSFEIELEYTPGRGPDADVNSVRNIVTKILIAIQGGTLFITNNQTDIILRNYATVLGQNRDRPQFAGPLPFTLRLQDLQDGKLSCGYSVTDKADGQRYLLYIDENKRVFFISRPKGGPRLSNSLSYIGESNHCARSVLDGELVGNKFYVFDCLVANGNNVLQNTSLDKRLAKAAQVVSACKRIGDVRLMMKTFYMSYQDGVKSFKMKNNSYVMKIKDTKDIFDMAGKIWNSRDKKDYTLDGLVFTPIALNYFNKEIYKWKTTNTIDFFILKREPNIFVLHIASKDPTEGHQYKNLPFTGFDGNGTFLNQRNENVRNMMFDDQTVTNEIKNGIVTVSSKNFKEFQDKTVVEFKWYGKKFIPVKTRFDKQFSNGIGATNDAWESITHPISLNALSRPKYISCIRRYHNKIKDHLIKTYMSRVTVLDIGSGRGGDIHKYTKHRSQYVVGVDIEDVEYDYPRDKMEFYKVNDTEYSIKDLLANKRSRQQNGFDVVNCQFAAHYFFKNTAKLENFVENVSQNIKRNGTFVLTFLNGDVVRKLLSDNNIAQGKGLGMRSKNGNEVFRITRKYKDDQSLVGDKILVRLYGTAYFAQKTSMEYLIYPSEFVNYMDTKGFSLQSQRQFDKFCDMFDIECNNMNTPERRYSFMNMAMVFKKR